MNIYWVRHWVLKDHGACYAVKQSHIRLIEQAMQLASYARFARIRMYSSPR